MVNVGTEGPEGPYSSPRPATESYSNESKTESIVLSSSDTITGGPKGKRMGTLKSRALWNPILTWTLR